MGSAALNGESEEFTGAGIPTRPAATPIRSVGHKNRMPLVDFRVPASTTPQKRMMLAEDAQIQ